MYHSIKINVYKNQWEFISHYIQLTCHTNGSQRETIKADYHLNLLCTHYLISAPQLSALMSEVAAHISSFSSTFIIICSHTSTELMVTTNPTLHFSIRFPGYFITFDVLLLALKADNYWARLLTLRIILSQFTPKGIFDSKRRVQYLKHKIHLQKVSGGFSLPVDNHTEKLQKKKKNSIQEVECQDRTGCEIAQPILPESGWNK